MDVVLLHNPRCLVSRRVLELLKAEGLEPVVVDYHKEPPTTDQLRVLLKLLELTPRQLMRTKEPVYRQLGLNDPALSEGQLIHAMVGNPVLIDGPIVVTEDEAVLARPAEKVFNVL